MFFSIARPDSNAIPKQLEIDSSLKLEVHKEHCMLNNLIVSNKNEE